MTSNVQNLIVVYFLLLFSHFFLQIYNQVTFFLVKLVHIGFYITVMYIYYIGDLFTLNDLYRHRLLSIRHFSIIAKVICKFCYFFVDNSKDFWINSVKAINPFENFIKQKKQFREFFNVQTACLDVSSSQRNLSTRTLI